MKVFKEGTIGVYRWTATVSHTSSEDGINGGRVLSLSIKYRLREVVKYDCGWYLEPITLEELSVVNEILGYFPL